MELMELIELMKSLLTLSAYIFFAVLCICTSLHIGGKADKVLEDMYHHNDHHQYHPDTLRYNRYQRQGFAYDVLGLLSIYMVYQEIQNVLHLISA